MTVLQEQKLGYGGRVSDIVTDSFICAVTTAKEGLFKGLSTAVWRVPGTPCAKISYSQGVRTRDRQEMHSLIVQAIDAAGAKGHSLREAIDIATAELRERGTLRQVVNLAD